MLTPAIRANVCVAGGCLEIPLLLRWPVLFRGVHCFRRVISFCGNSCSVLGSIGGYPEVWCTPCGRSASGGNLRYFFPCWNRAFVTIEEQFGEWHYSVAFLDACGRSSQSLPHPGFRIGGFGGEISVQIFAGNDGLSQTAEMRPTHLREDADWIYATDDCCGLRMRIARLAEIFFHGSSGSADWALRAFEPEGHLVCAITPPKGSDPGERRETRIKLEAAWEENAK